jgi:hypothetical protein
MTGPGAAQAPSTGCGHPRHLLPPTPAADCVGRHVALVWAVACGAPTGALAMVEPAAGTGPAELISRQHPAGNQAEPGHTTKEATMPRAVLYYLAQAWATDPHHQPRPPAQARTKGRTP